MQWRYHGRPQLAPRPRARHGHARQTAGNQSSGPDGGNAELSIDVELDHGGARQFPHAVLALRSRTGTTRSEDRSAGEGRRPDSRGGRRIVRRLRGFHRSEEQKPGKARSTFSIGVIYAICGFSDPIYFTLQTPPRNLQSLTEFFLPVIQRPPTERLINQTD